MSPTGITTNTPSQVSTTEAKYIEAGTLGTYGVTPVPCNTPQVQGDIRSHARIAFNPTTDYENLELEISVFSGLAFTTVAYLLSGNALDMSSDKLVKILASSTCKARASTGQETAVHPSAFQVGILPFLADTLLRSIRLKERLAEQTEATSHADDQVHLNALQALKTNLVSFDPSSIIATGIKMGVTPQSIDDDVHLTMSRVEEAVVEGGEASCLRTWVRWPGKQNFQLNHTIVRITVQTDDKLSFCRRGLVEGDSKAAHERILLWANGTTILTANLNGIRYEMVGKTDQDWRALMKVPGTRCDLNMTVEKLMRVEAGKRAEQDDWNIITEPNWLRMSQIKGQTSATVNLPGVPQFSAEDDKAEWWTPPLQSDQSLARRKCGDSADDLSA